MEVDELETEVNEREGGSTTNDTPPCPCDVLMIPTTAHSSLPQKGAPPAVEASKSAVQQVPVAADTIMHRPKNMRSIADLLDWIGENDISWQADRAWTGTAAKARINR